MRAPSPGRVGVRVKGDDPGQGFWAVDDPGGRLWGGKQAVTPGFVVRTGRNDAHEPREAPLTLAGVPPPSSTVPRTPRPGRVHLRRSPAWWSVATWFS